MVASGAMSSAVLTSAKMVRRINAETTLERKVALAVECADKVETDPSYDRTDVLRILKAVRGLLEEAMRIAAPPSSPRRGSRAATAVSYLAFGQKVAEFGKYLGIFGADSSALGDAVGRVAYKRAPAAKAGKTAKPVPRKKSGAEVVKSRKAKPPAKRAAQGRPAPKKTPARKSQPKKTVGRKAPTRRPAR